MGKSVSGTKISKRGARGIQSLIFVASFILSALLALGNLSVGRVLGMRAKLIASNQPLLPYYLSLQGLQTLVPLDLFLILYTASAILVVITLRVLAEAQLTVDEKPEHAQALAVKAGKYIEWALNGVVFFMALEFSSTLTSFYIIFQDNYWAAIMLCAGVALCARYLMHKVANI